MIQYPKKWKRDQSKSRSRDRSNHVTMHDQDTVFMDEQMVMKKQMKGSFNGAITPAEHQYGIAYKNKELNQTQRSLDKLQKYIPEIHHLVQTIDEFEQTSGHGQDND